MAVVAISGLLVSLSEAGMAGSATAAAATATSQSAASSVRTESSAKILKRSATLGYHQTRTAALPQDHTGHRARSTATVSVKATSTATVTVTVRAGTLQASATATVTASASRSSKKSVTRSASTKAKALTAARSAAYSQASASAKQLAKAGADALATAKAKAGAEATAKARLTALQATTTPTAPTAPIRPAMPVGNLPGWTQVYADDFSGTTLNRSAWTSYNSWAPSSNPNTGWWMSNHALVGGGLLTLKGSVDRAANPAGRVVTAGVGLWNLPKQTYGKYEILARIDRCPDVKYAWLLWPYSGQWPGDGEIDFAEDEGGQRSTTTASLLYKNAAGRADALPQDRVSPSVDFSGWHEIGVEWTPTSVRYTLDGSYWGQTKTAHIPNKPMTMVLQTEGKLNPSAVTIGSRTCSAQIDWVVQYRMNK